MLSGTLLMLTGHWHPESGHFAVQCPVSYRILTSVRSALTGRVRLGNYLSGTSLELTGRRNPAFGHFSLSVRSQPDGSSCDRTIPSASGHNQTSVRSALTGYVRSGNSLSRTSLELTRLWNPASNHFSLSIRSQPDGSS